MERKLIQEREEKREQKLVAHENRGHSPGSLQHLLDKHPSFEEVQLPAINKRFYNPLKICISQPFTYFHPSYYVGSSIAFFRCFNKPLHKIYYYLIYSKKGSHQFFHHGLHIWRNPLKPFNSQKYFWCFNICCQHISVFMFVQGLFKPRSRLVVIQLALILIAEPKFASISASIQFVFPDRLCWWTQRHEVIQLCRRPV